MARIRLIILLLLVLPVAAWAQKKHLGDQVVGRMGYYQAIPTYMYEFDRTGDYDILAKVAKCYQVARKYDSATYFFRKLAAKQQIRDSAVLVDYATALIAAGAYGTAENVVRQYEQLKPGSDGMDRIKTNIQLDKTVLDKRSSVGVRNATNINTRNDEFSPFVISDNIIYCGQEKDRSYNYDGRPFIDLLEARRDVYGRLTDSRTVPGKVNTPQHEGPAVVHKGTLFFTRNTASKHETGRFYGGEVLLKILTATLTDKGWGNVREFEWNNDRWSVGHPALSPDGQYLVFVSSQRQAATGTDLFICKRNGDRWTRPRPMESLNTEYNEMFPMFKDDTTLVFSSNGLPGLGGLDMFRARFADGRAEDPKNLGKPFNSNRDDFGITYTNAEGTAGYFSSDRAGGKGGDDIYEFNNAALRVDLVVLNSRTRKPIRLAQLQFNDSNDVRNLATDDKGRAQLEVSRIAPEPITIVKDSFKTKQVKVPAGTLNDTTIIVLLDPGQTTHLKGQLTDAETPVRGQAKLRDPLDNTTLLTNTDPRGNYDFIVDPDREYDLEVNADNYFKDRRKVRPAEQPRVNNRMYKMELNKAIKIKNIYYDFDKYDLRPESVRICDTVHFLLVNNPNVNLEISSHTDIRGTDNYNENLAMMRGQEVVKYLVARGIDESRLTVRVYGERKPARPCPDGTPCPEPLHQLNRRTEFRVTGY